MKTKYSFLLAVVIFSCDRRTHSETTEYNQTSLTTNTLDSLAIFPLNYQMEFIATNSNDQIVLLFQRETIDTFHYKIELLRKWKGLPLDHGTVQIQKINSENVYFFKGGNKDCDVIIKIHTKKGLQKTDELSANLERRCRQTSLNIGISEFPAMWKKGQGLRR